MSINKILNISPDAEGIFLKRCNRFAVEVDVGGSTEYVHLHDPGRLKELLYPGNRVLLKRAKNRERKTKWDIIAADSREGFILINSSYHRNIAENIILSEKILPYRGITEFKPEKKYGSSRLDFYFKIDSREVWIEVKGCTLLKDDGTAMFPDAPTVRGVKHIRHLIEIKNSGADAALVILVLVDADRFVPNSETDPDFAQAFVDAVEAGVEIYPVKLSYNRSSIEFHRIIDFKINSQDRH